MRALILGLAALGLAAGQPAQASDKPLVFGTPGVPPVFLSVQTFVAIEEGFFKKHGVDVSVRPFDAGGVRAVVTGDVDFTASLTPIIVNMVANAKVPLVGFYGLENSTWLIASTDPTITSCKDLPKAPIGVDAPGGARSAALRQMAVPCGVKFESLQQVGLSSGVGAAMAAGQLKLGVLHLDDIAVIEAKLGKPLTIVTELRRFNPDGHYILFTTRADHLAKNRDRFVRLVAGLIEAEAFMRDPNNWDRVAKIAAVTGRTADQAKQALKEFIKLEFWPRGHDGLNPKRIEAEIKTQLEVGGITAGNAPPDMNKLIDRSIFKDAFALVNKAK